jgi:predicted aspartyl protease
MPALKRAGVVAKQLVAARWATKSRPKSQHAFPHNASAMSPNRSRMDPRAAIGRVEGQRGRRALAVALALISAGFDTIFAGDGEPDQSLSDPVSSPTSPSEAVPDDVVTKPDYEAATRPDQIGRIIIPVIVNDRGPFKFVLDTGANRTVLTPHLVAALGLRATEDNAVTMNGVTGAAAVPTAFVERVAAGDVVLERQRLPVADALTSGVDGILGVEGFSAKRIMVDFKSGKIEIRNARHERPLSWAMRIPAQLRFGHLIVIDAYVNRVRVKAVIDTGSQYTLGNDALRAALFPYAQTRLLNPRIDVVGETLAKQPGERRLVRIIKAGDVQATHFNVVFGEFYVFKLWNLDTRPALVIGMDMIGSLDAFAIDYDRCEVQLLAREQPFTRQRGSSSDAWTGR